eukprot:GHVU01199467.1.p1 GENE.GHVU01199467.1~~GHVU01199467.1.p1  ORF type:complete len:167 (+),score=5.90 GHVU01199467.1:489-989(+)
MHACMLVLVHMRCLQSVSYEIPTSTYSFGRARSWGPEWWELVCELMCLCVCLSGCLPVCLHACARLSWGGCRGDCGYMYVRMQRAVMTRLENERKWSLPLTDSIAAAHKIDANLFELYPQKANVKEAEIDYDAEPTKLVPASVIPQALHLSYLNGARGLMLRYLTR